MMLMECPAVDVGMPLSDTEEVYLKASMQVQTDYEWASCHFGDGLKAWHLKLYVLLERSRKIPLEEFQPMNQMAALLACPALELHHGPSAYFKFKSSGRGKNASAKNRVLLLRHQQRVQVGCRSRTAGLEAVSPRTRSTLI